MKDTSTLSQRLRMFGVYAVLIAAAFLILFGVVNSFNTNHKLENQKNDTEKLLQEVKGLSEENKKLNQTSNNYAYCNAVLLSQYTQTRAAITIKDLNQCVLSSFPTGTNAPQQFGAAINSLQPASSNTPNTSTTTNSTTTNNTTTNQGGGNQGNGGTTQPALTIPNLLQLNVPCLSVIGVVRTCQ